MALTLHICPGDNRAVVWASGDVDTNVAEVFRDMMLSVMRRHSPSLLLDLSGVSIMSAIRSGSAVIRFTRACIISDQQPEEAERPFPFLAVHRLQLGVDQLERPGR